MAALTGHGVTFTITDDAGNVQTGAVLTVVGPLPAVTAQPSLTSSSPGGTVRLGPLPIGDYTVTAASGRQVTWTVYADPAQAQATADAAAAAAPMSSLGTAAFAAVGAFDAAGAGTAAAAALGVPAAIAAAVAPLTVAPTGAIPAWAANTVYRVGQLVSNGGFVWSSTSNHTSTASFTGQAPAGNWTNPVPTGAVSGGSSAPRVVTVPYAATVAPNADTTDILNVGALTGNLTLANPSSAATPTDGRSIRLRFQQDSTGMRVITFGPAYAFGSDVPLSAVPTAASAKWEMLIQYNAADATWRVLGIIRGF